MTFPTVLPAFFAPSAVASAAFSVPLAAASPVFFAEDADATPPSIRPSYVLLAIGPHLPHCPAGFVIDSDGYIMTNAHVVSGARRVQVVLPSGEADGTLKTALTGKSIILPARIVGITTELDLPS